MAWEINRFGVKPSGLASWRYVRILVDDNGNISVEDVPGKPSINLDCLSDYKKNDRGIWAGQLITEFCNFTTFTNFRVYAQDCRPWAYVQTDLNANKCGYKEPLPEPAVPPNPFGTASYGEYKYLNFCDDENTPISIKVFKKNYNGVSSDLGYGGAAPVILSYKNTGDDKFSPIRGLECKLTLTSITDFSLQQFYTSDEREYRLEVLKAGKLKFKGFITPSDAQEEFIAPPYDLTLNANDGLAALKKVSYPIPVGSTIDIKQNFVKILAYCLAKTNLDLDIITACNLYASGMANGIDDDPLWQAEVNPLRMNKDGVIYNCYEALEAVCKLFGGFLVQDNGAWNFIRQSELSNAIIRRRAYNSKGLFLFSQQYNNLRSASCESEDISILDESPIIRIGNAYKRAEVKLDFGNVPSIIYNGDFELFDGQNFNYWTRFGGINISQIQRVLKTTSGDVPVDNHALRFNEAVDNGKYLESSPVFIRYKDKLTVSYNVGPTDTQVIIVPKRVYFFKLRIKLGEYYLTNQRGQYEWLKELVTVTNIVDNANGNFDSYKLSFEIPEAPATGKMTFQLYGFQKMAYTYFPAYVKVNGFNREVVEAHYEYVADNSYSPVAIDNFSVKKSNSNNETDIISTLYMSEQDGFFTNKPDPTILIYGDFLQTNLSDIAINETAIINNLYAIYFNGQYTNGWYDYGVTSSSMPIGLMLAKSIMKAYQSPFRFLSSTFLGDDISYLDVFNVNLPNNDSFSSRTFALLSGDINLKTNEISNADYVEIFSKPAKTVDITAPGYSGVDFPPVVQNPNSNAGTTIGIFTDEFTEEFK
jgi:hypothetical protein